MGVQRLDQPSIIEVAQGIDLLGWVQDFVEQAAETQIGTNLPDLVDEIQDVRPETVAR